jgi:hypothetical protein
MMVTDGLGRMSKKAVMAYLKVLYPHSAGGLRKTMTNQSQDSWLEGLRTELE